MARKKDSKISAEKPHESYLWEAFRKGQNWAFSRIFNDYYDQLYLYGLRFLNIEIELQDLLQDYFFKLWNKRWKLPRVYNVKAYLYKSFRLLLIDYFRSAKNHLIHEKSSSEEIPFSISHEELMIKNEETKILSEKLEFALKNLTNKQKEVIYLRFYQGLGYREIAKIMTIKYQTVRNLMHNALNSLRGNI